MVFGFFCFVFSVHIFFNLFASLGPDGTGADERNVRQIKGGRKLVENKRNP